MKRGWRATALALAVAALAACESTPRAGACAGDVVATLRFQGTPPASGTGCPAAGAPAVAFTGTVAFGDGDEAHLCLDRAEAAPLTGHHDGDHLVLGGATVDVTLDACACPLTVTEVLEGDLVRTGGAVTGFQGELRDALAPAGGDASGCERGGGVTCGVPCEARWEVTGAP